jgi:hypothetical protein
MAAKFEKIEKEKLDFIKDNAGPGQGAWFLGRFLFWDKTIKRSLIALEKTQRQFNKLLGIFSWIIIFAGWAAFFAWIYLHKASLQLEPLNLFFFWTKPHLLITFFLLSLWFDLFLFYKASSAAASKKRINYKLFQDDKNKQEVRRYNVARSFSEDTWRVVEDAFLLAKKLGKKQANIIHFFRAALKNKEVQTLFIRLDVDATKLVAMVDRQLAKEIGQEETGHGAIADSLQEVFISAFTDAYYRQQKSVDILNVILFCAEKDENLAEILYELEVDADKIINTISWFRVSKKLSDRYHEYRKLAFFKPGTGMNRSYTAIATPTLDYFSHDLTLRAKAGSLDLCVGRDPFLITLVGGLLIMTIIIYLTEGWKRKSHLAILTVLLSLLLTLILSIIFTKLTRLTGLAQEEAVFLIGVGQAEINFRGLLLAGMIIGAIGVLDDIVVGQIESVARIKEANPKLPPKKVFSLAYKIGNTHLGAIINTLFLTYAGAALPLLLLFVWT